MKLHEYLAKDLFESKGVPVPRRHLVKTADEARIAAQALGGPVVLKAQVLIAGRGKAGGILSALTPEEAHRKAEKLLNFRIKGIPVTSILVEERIEISKELYLALTIDRSERKPVLIASGEGGVDLEELAQSKPEAIVKKHLEPLLGLRAFEARQVSKAIGLSGDIASNFVTMALKFYALFEELDCDLLESNPLALTADQKLVAADARITLDDNASYRHPQYRRSVEELTPLEGLASQKGFSFVELDGDIGVIGNGAGLVMATLDMVSHYGGKPANFLDVGGGARAEEVKQAMELVLGHPRVRAVLVNILGGITRCDEVAQGMVDALREAKAKIPLVVRLVGTNEAEGRHILSTAGISYLDSMEQAARAAIATLK